MRIRADLTSVVHIPGAVLAAGDVVPEGVELDARLLEDQPEAELDEAKPDEAKPSSKA